ncbi:hypothetical protein M501DRAFT_289533 [Patellaria atrata CBS 101060]|uniref:Aflatoxin regulatory protein domain-containing protein n=1 Tax=Patellaria atrata CBS 101060 TaxID=1346257 RepID=A0A9P4S5Q4_9PEZI|nr:hypothetical protein M501DRAFT_289533 [Patellaria atrata CBS 101060]
MECGCHDIEQSVYGNTLPELNSNIASWNSYEQEQSDYPPISDFPPLDRIHSPIMGNDTHEEFDFDDFCVPLSAPMSPVQLPTPMDTRLEDDLAQSLSPVRSRGNEHHSFSRNSCSYQPRSCFDIALNILQKLHTPPNICLSLCDQPYMGSSPRRRDTDGIQTNQDVVDLLSNILTCSCSLNARIQLLLTTIFGKLVASCRTTFKKGYECNIHNKSDDLDTNLNQAKEGMLQGTDTYNFTYSTAAEVRNSIQTATSNLLNIETLLEQISRRLQEAQSVKPLETFLWGSTPLISEQPALAETVYKSLIRYLGREIQATKVDMKLAMDLKFYKQSHPEFQLPTKIKHKGQEGYLDWGPSKNLKIAA